MAQLNRVFVSLAAFDRGEQCKSNLRLQSLVIAYQLAGEQPATIAEISPAAALDSAPLVATLGAGGFQAKWINETFTLIADHPGSYASFQLSLMFSLVCGRGAPATNACTRVYWLAVQDGGPAANPAVVLAEMTPVLALPPGLAFNQVTPARNDSAAGKLDLSYLQEIACGCGLRLDEVENEDAETPGFPPIAVPVVPGQLFQENDGCRLVAHAVVTW